jgi:hypothetical protein
MYGSTRRRSFNAVRISHTDPTRPSPHRSQVPAVVGTGRDRGFDRGNSERATKADRLVLDHGRLRLMTPNALPAAGGRACSPSSFGMMPGHHERRGPSAKVPTKASGWRSTVRRSIRPTRRPYKLELEEDDR